jgi:CPA1 family monovalent cation:H+ antiporter
MGLLLPDDLSLPEWSYTFSVKEFIIAITIGSIYFTLMIKAPTIGRMVRWLKIDALLPHEQLGYFKSKALIYREMGAHIIELHKHNQISAEQYQTFSTHYQQLYQQVCQQGQEQSLDSRHVVDTMLRIYTLALQKIELKKLFQHNEISESIYRKNLNILETQTERVERDQPKLKSLNEYLSTWAGKFLNNAIVRRILLLSTKQNQSQQLYLYYQTQYKLISKVLDELYELENSPLAELFDDPRAVQDVISIYHSLISKTKQEMQHEISSNKELLDDLNEQSANAQLHTVQDDTLKGLQEKEIISNKLYVLLNKEMND